MQNFFIFFVLFLLSAMSYAAPTVDSCVPTTYKIDGNNIILPGSPEAKKSHIYIFTNKSPRGVFIDHPVQNPGASAGWSSYVRPANWSAIVLNKKNFAVRCVMIQPGKVVTLNCSDTISVCSPNVTTKTPLKGNAWLVEDKSWEDLVKVFEKRGIMITTEKTK